MARHVAVVLLVAVAFAALAVSAARPSPDELPRKEPVGGKEHGREPRGIKKFLHKVGDKAKHAGVKVKAAAKKVAGAVNVDKLKNCLRSTPGVAETVADTVTGCARSAKTGMAAIASCAAAKGSIPAARATAHLAVCMG